MFFVFDGIDGGGKTTQLSRFVQWLEESGQQVVTCKDPGSTELGEQLRTILLSKHETPISIRTEMMLFTAARAQLVDQIVRPALSQGKAVVLDRYILSTVVYQGHAGNLDPEHLWTVNRIATDNLMPDLTFILDLPVDVAMQRLGSSLDRMESRGGAYFERVRDGFITESKRSSDQIRVLDATASPDEIQAEIRQIASKQFSSQLL